MTIVPKLAHPPRLAAWLVDLFAPADHAGPILGDLGEEFSDIATKSGVVSARRWYWRQAGKTIAHLASAALRVTPWSLPGAVLLGFVLRRLGFSLLVALVRMQRYFVVHYELVTWCILIARIVEMTLIGCVVAAVAKGREIIATMVLIIASLAVVGLNLFQLTQNPPPQMPIPIPWTAVLLPNFEDWMLILLGGILIRKIRSASPGQHYAP